jgi:hypothetical protein
MVVPLASATTPSKGRLEAPIMMILKDRPAEHDILSCRVNSEP